MEKNGWKEDKEVNEKVSKERKQDAEEIGRKEGKREERMERRGMIEGNKEMKYANEVRGKSL